VRAFPDSAVKRSSNRAAVQVPK